FERLADETRHQDSLVEMIPGTRVATTTPMEFEVVGQGAGNRTLDWLISSVPRPVLLDVKRRTTDFILQMQQTHSKQISPEPDHDPSLLFRSVEAKFVPTDPTLRLQGAWICTEIQQEEEQLHIAFNRLNARKVHFAALGDWKSDIYLLVRREEDRPYLMDLF